MLYGIGVDTATISRLARSIQNPRFLQRVYGAQEQELIASRGNGAAQTAAVNFAAKEALCKALGTGLGVYPLCEMQLLRRSSGQPYFVFGGKLAQAVQQNHWQVLASVTHEGDAATAFIVITSEEPV